MSGNYNRSIDLKDTVELPANAPPEREYLP